MAQAPATLVRRATDAATTKAWLAAIDAHPAWRDRSSTHVGAFNSFSSSLRLAAVTSLDSVEIAGVLLRGEVGATCRDRLGDELACDIDQSWVRRQYAPARCPSGHTPHSWHQDGALAFDFLAHPVPSPVDALLVMVTCWIALSACGFDAPGLEFAASDRPDLLRPEALTDTAVRAGHDASAFEHPILEPGDCLVFGGSVLHHTYVTPTMRNDRTSLEIRLFNANRIASRLRGDRFAILK